MDNQIKIDVRFEDYNGLIFKHFCPYCMEEIEKPVLYEERSVECNNCKNILNLNWKSYISDIENFLSEKIRYKMKSSNAYDDEDSFCEALSEVIEEIYRADSSECYDVAREVFENTQDFEDEHDIAKEIIELLDVPSFSAEEYVDYNDNFEEDEDKSEEYEEDNYN